MVRSSSSCVGSLVEASCLHKHERRCLPGRHSFSWVFLDASLLQICLGLSDLRDKKQHSGEELFPGSPVEITVDLMIKTMLIRVPSTAKWKATKRGFPREFCRSVGSQYVCGNTRWFLHMPIINSSDSSALWKTGVSCPGIGVHRHKRDGEILFWSGSHNCSIMPVRPNQSNSFCDCFNPFYSCHLKMLLDIFLSAHAWECSQEIGKYFVNPYEISNNYVLAAWQAVQWIPSVSIFNSTKKINSSDLLISRVCPLKKAEGALPWTLNLIVMAVGTCAYSKFILLSVV